MTFPPRRNTVGAMSAIPMQLRADRAIIKRQQQEQIHETFCAGQLDQFKVAQKGLWENKSAVVIKNNRIKAKASEFEAHHKASLQDRRRRLAEKLSKEQKAYEREMVEKEETPQQRMDKMAVRAYELKKRREDERKAFVQEKLYQQWRSGIDDLRTMDTQIVELKCIAERDFQLDEKAARDAEEKAHDEFYTRLWNEGYQAKIEREGREKELKKDRSEVQKNTLGVQLAMKGQRVKEEKDEEAVEAEEMKKLWAQQEIEEKEAIVRQRVVAKEERKKADEYMEIQQAQRAEEERLESEFDKDFIAGVLERERKMAEAEEAEKAKAKKKAVEYTEALKIEMAQKAESEENLIKLQHEESERQWAKRYEQWEKEELARRSLMEEVYGDRAEQVRLKHQQREQLKEELERERGLGEKECERLAEIEQERGEAEMLIAKRHQEELFRQMDFHQVQRHRQLQQHAIEQRQAAIAEEKIRRAVASEKEKAHSIMKDVMDKRATQRPNVTAPWDR